MNRFFKTKTNTVLSIILVIVAIAVSVTGILNSSLVVSDGASADIACIETTAIKQVFANGIENTTAQPATVEITTVPATTQVATTAQQTTVKPTQKPTEKPTQAPTIPFATAIPPKEPADYDAQYAAGYLIAIDNPDKIYKCAKVTLTDEDRDLLECLCYGEFGVGGFIGAALIAQAVKDAMCFDGYPTVESVIKNCHYTGKTTTGTSEDCKRAVRYIFDENHDAVQHRIMYMYNPVLVDSAFHESQNYILTYQDVRFFDRWNY